VPREHSATPNPTSAFAKMESQPIPAVPRQKAVNATQCVEGEHTAAGVVSACAGGVGWCQSAAGRSAGGWRHVWRASVSACMEGIGGVESAGARGSVDLWPTVAIAEVDVLV